MTSIFQRPPRSARSISSQYAEIPVRTETELLNAIGAIGARGNAAALPAVGGSVLICAPLQLTKPVIIPETCPGLTIRAAAKFPITPTPATILATMFDVRAEFFTVRDLFAFGAQDLVSGLFTSYFTTFVTVSGGASIGRSRIRPALIDNEAFVDRLFVDNSAGAASLAEISRNRQSNATSASALAVVAVDSITARVVDNILRRSASGIDAVNVGVNGGGAAIEGNECNGQKITTLANTGHSSVVGNTNCGTITLGNVSDVQAGNT